MPIRTQIIDVQRKPAKCPVCGGEIWDIIYGTGDMTEIEFLMEYNKSAIMGGDIIPRRPPNWACGCGCKRFRKINPDGTDAPVKVKLLKNVRPAKEGKWVRSEEMPQEELPPAPYEPKYYTGLVRDVAAWVSGIELVEKFIGPDEIFHDAEIDDIHLSRMDDSITIRMWTDSGVNHGKYYYLTWKLESCDALTMYNFYMPGDCFVYELEFETLSYRNDAIKIIFDGCNIEAICKHITITVEEAPKESFDEH